MPPAELLHTLFCVLLLLLLLLLDKVNEKVGGERRSVLLLSLFCAMLAQLRVGLLSWSLLELSMLCVVPFCIRSPSVSLLRLLLLRLSLLLGLFPV